MTDNWEGRQLIEEGNLDIGDQVVRCEICGGTGVIQYNLNSNPNTFIGFAAARCSWCGGTGCEPCEVTNKKEKIHLKKAATINEQEIQRRIVRIARDLCACAETWEHDTRLLGNIRASEIRDLCNWVIKHNAELFENACK